MKPAPTRSLKDRLLQQEDLNFLLTNRVPRIALTRFIGWFSQIEIPLVRDVSIAIWRAFSDLDLSEARKTHFKSMHDCFIRELKPGLRPINTEAQVLSSPCDAIVGESGSIDGVTVFQAKGFPYTLLDLLGDEATAERYRDGCYATLRLTSTMYHRFHAPADCHVDRVNYISGDTWNVNPVALKRVERLYCKNERAVIRTRMRATGDEITLVPVAAILVASIRLHFLDVLLHVKYRGPNELSCDADFDKGAEMGWFQHGSTIIVFAPKGYSMCEGLPPGTRIKMDQRLMQF